MLVLNDNLTLYEILVLPRTHMLFILLVTGHFGENCTGGSCSRTDAPRKDRMRWQLGLIEVVVVVVVVVRIVVVVELQVSRERTMGEGKTRSRVTTRGVVG